MALFRLGSLTGQSSFIDSAERVLQLVSKQVAQHPTGFGHLLGALDIYHNGSTEVLITGNRSDLVKIVNSYLLPNVVLAWGESFSSPLWKNRSGDQAWVCKNFECELPITTTEDLEKSLKE